MHVKIVCIAIIAVFMALAVLGAVVAMSVHDHHAAEGTIRTGDFSRNKEGHVVCLTVGVNTKICASSLD